MTSESAEAETKFHDRAEVYDRVIGLARSMTATWSGMSPEARGDREGAGFADVHAIMNASPDLKTAWIKGHLLIRPASRADLYNAAAQALQCVLPAELATLSLFFVELGTPVLLRGGWEPDWCVWLRSHARAMISLKLWMHKVESTPDGRSWGDQRDNKHLGFGDMSWRRLFSTGGCSQPIKNSGHTARSAEFLFGERPALEQAWAEGYQNWLAEADDLFRGRVLRSDLGARASDLKAGQADLLQGQYRGTYRQAKPIAARLRVHLDQGLAPLFPPESPRSLPWTRGLSVEGGPDALSQEELDLLVGAAL
jgi:hypothetical protein